MEPNATPGNGWFSTLMRRVKAIGLFDSSKKFGKRIQPHIPEIYKLALDKEGNPDLSKYETFEAFQAAHKAAVEDALKAGRMTADRADQLGHFTAYPELAKYKTDRKEGATENPEEGLVQYPQRRKRTRLIMSNTAATLIFVGLLAVASAIMAAAWMDRSTRPRYQVTSDRKFLVLDTVTGQVFELKERYPKWVWEEIGTELRSKPPSQ